LQFIRDGCDRLFVTDIDADKLHETKLQAEALREGVRVEAVVGDIASVEFSQSLAGKAVSEFGRLDYAVNAAGISGSRGSTGGLSYEDWRKTQQVNADGVWLCMHGELKAMMEQELVDGYQILALLT